MTISLGDRFIRLIRCRLEDVTTRKETGLVVFKTTRLKHTRYLCDNSLKTWKDIFSFSVVDKGSFREKVIKLSVSRCKWVPSQNQ